MPYLEDEDAARHGLTFEAWKNKGKKLMERREKNIAGNHHPYKGISDSDVELLHKYEEYDAGVFI